MRLLARIGGWLFLMVALVTAAMFHGGPASAPAVADDPVTVEANVPSGEPLYVEGQVLVQYHDASQIPSLGELQQRPNFAGQQRNQIHAMEIQAWKPGLVIAQVTGDVLDAVAAFEQDPAVRYAEPNYMRYGQKIPNEVLFDRMDNFEMSRATLGWDIRTVASGVTVAVVDTGIDFAHPDLAPNIKAGATHLNARGNESGQPAADDSGHGTAVAGVIGAVGNNGQFAVGAAWGVTLLPVRACGTAQLACNVADEARAIDMAIANGANIINLSLGGYFSSNTERDAVTRAFDAGVLVVAAAGNFGKLGKFGQSQELENQIFYPAGYRRETTPGVFEDLVLGVGSIDSVPNPDILANAHLSSFSNWGDMTDVVAVGRNVITTAPSAEVASPIFDCPPGNPTACYYTQKVGQINGTSFSAPMVTGLAALLKAQFPDFTNKQLHAAVISSARDVGDQGTNGRNDEFGFGVVDFFNALSGQGGAVNDAFAVAVATNPIVTNQVYITIKQRQSLVGDPTLSVVIKQDGQPDRNIPITPSPLESDPTIRFARILVNGPATIEAEIQGVLASNLEVRTLAVSYEKER